MGGSAQTGRRACMEKHTLLGCSTPLSNNIWQRRNYSRRRSRERSPVAADTWLPCVHVRGLIRLAVPNSFPCSHLGVGITMGMIHGVIPTATDLAPARIWEECDLTILFFQRPIPVCSSPRPGLKHASVPREGSGEKQRERNSGESETVCVCVFL